MSVKKQRYASGIKEASWRTVNLDNFSLKLMNFKCFADEPQGFDKIKPFNIIIGRNNSGKSSILDAFPYLVSNKFNIPPELWHNQQPSQIIATAPMPEEVVRRVFGKNVSGGGIPSNHWQFGRHYVGTRITWCMNAGRDDALVALDDCPNGTRPLDRIREQERMGFASKLAISMPNPFQGKSFQRIHAERNILPEQDQSDLSVSGDGSGATNIIQNFINKATLPSSLVEKTLLEQLNVIFSPDALFQRIVCQQLEDEKWEVYLEEEHKGRISLSQSGSGLKTIIIVLIHIFLVPYVEKKDLSDFVLGCEELENNLHPALLRRLLSYLFQHAIDNDTTFFLTTHSNVAIDQFSRNKQAQIVHVTHDGAKATCRTMHTYIDNSGLLDDLDVRASDLLQANCIIWVEGPSDRIYLNRWVELWSNGKLTEGLHYQSVFYGGRLLAHLHATEDDDNSGVSLLRANRNCCILIDSDKRTRGSRINRTKNRIVTEVKSIGGLAWVTKGREIENYLPSSAIARYLNRDSVGQVGQYEDFSEYLDALESGAGRKFLRKKPLFAGQLAPYLERDDCSSILDADTRISELCKFITRCNKTHDLA